MTRRFIAIVRRHDAEFLIGTLYLFLKAGSWFTTPEQPFLYATMHGHSDDAFGALLVIAAARYCYERTSD